MYGDGGGEVVLLSFFLLLLLEVEVMLIVRSRSRILPLPLGLDFKMESASENSDEVEGMHGNTCTRVLNSRHGPCMSYTLRVSAGCRSGNDSEWRRTAQETMHFTRGSRDMRLLEAYASCPISYRLVYYQKRSKEANLGE